MIAGEYRELPASLDKSVRHMVAVGVRSLV
jgi:hypothetical protein